MTLPNIFGSGTGGSGTGGVLGTAQNKVNDFLGGVKLPSVNVNTNNQVGIDDSTKKLVIGGLVVVALLMFTSKKR
jgi:hypothetical protein